MKNKILLVVLLSFTYVTAQGEFYVGLHYFKVKSEYANEFIEDEKNYYSKIHKARIDSGDKIAWDMWRLQKNDIVKLYLFLRTFKKLTSHLKWVILIKCFQNLSLKEKKEKMVLGSKFIQTVFKGGFVPSSGTPPKIAILNFIDAKAGKWF